MGLSEEISGSMEDFSSQVHGVRRAAASQMECIFDIKIEESIKIIDLELIF